MVIHSVTVGRILPLAMFTEQLFDTLVRDKSILVQAPENILSNPEIKQQTNAHVSAINLLNHFSSYCISQRCFLKI